MPDIIQPCKVALRGCTIKGINVTPQIQGISIFETMCKPYITATISVNDSGNIINNLGLKGGERIEFAVDNGMQNSKSIYDSVQYILSIDETEINDNYRTMFYSIRTATESFFNNRANIVQQSFMNIPGTAAAAQIHEQYVGGDATLNIVMASLGLIAKTESGGYNTNNKKPFKAIKDILERLSYGGIDTGSTVYFRDRYQYVMAPLEVLFMTMGSQEHFIQKQTWGTNYLEAMGGGDIYRSIIHGTTKVDEDKDRQRGAMAAVSAAAMGAANLWDQNLGTEALLNAFATAAQGIAGSVASQFTRGRMGGLPNVMQTDSRRQAPSTDQQINMVAQNAFQARVKDGTNYLIKVPCQTGFNVTVGKGITADLLPPIGDADNNSAQTVGGQMLVADVNHECYFDDREVQGTTIMRAVQI
jgi:hypothetical protein